MEDRRKNVAKLEAMKGAGDAVKVDEVPRWFPEADWRDDVRMNAMMERFPDRLDMEDAYDGKMAFWFDVVRQYCVDTRTALVNVSGLRTACRRKGKFPVCLPDVFREMMLHETTSGSMVNSLIPLSSYPGASWEPVAEGWIRWGLRKSLSIPTYAAWGYLSSFLQRGLGKIDENALFVHPETFASLADELADDYENSILKGSGEPVLSWDCFARMYAGKFKNEAVLDKMLGELQRRKRAQLGLVGNLKIIKFGSESISRSDVEIAKLQRLEWLLHIRQEEMEKKMNDLKEETKALLAQGKRELAKARLRQKKGLERKYGVLHASLENVRELLDQIRIARTHAEVLKIFGTGAKTIKDVFEAAGVRGGSDDVYKLMEEVRDHMEDMEEISEAIAEPTAPASTRVEQQELEAELEELLALEEEEKKKPKEKVVPAERKPEKELEHDSVPEFPPVPVTPPHVAVDDDLSARLARLRQTEF